MHSSLGWELDAGSPTAHTHLRETSALQWPAAKAERGQRQGHFPDPGQGRRGHSLEVVTCRFQGGSGLVGHRPHHDSWVILVPAHQLLHHLKVVLQRLVVVALATGGEKRECVITCHGGRLGSMGSGHSPQHDAHARALINDHDPILVTELHHLLRIGVVAGTEGVGTKPEKQVEVLHQQWPVEALPSDLEDSNLE